MNECSRFPRTGMALVGAVTVLGLVTVAPLAHAQQPAANDTVTQIARQRYAEGVKAFDAGRYEEARAAFLQTYALKRHPAVLLNLGQSELKSHHDEDAGNHFQQFLREHTSATPEQRASAEKGLAEAKKKASQVVVSVDAAGADVSIDGTTIGKSPFYAPVFVKPGKHTVFAARDGRTAAVAIDVKAGAATTATLTLGTGAAPPPALPPMMPPPVSPPGAPPPVTPAPAMPPLVTPPPQGYQPPAVQPAGREPFLRWYKRKPLAWVGTGLTGAGLIMGIAGGAAAMSASSAGNDAVAQIKKHWAELHPGQAIPPVCGDQSTGAGVYAGYESACQTLKDDISIYHTDLAVAVAGWVLFGVGAAGTGLYALIDWYPSRGPVSSEPTKVMLVPIVSPTDKGIGLVGTF